MLAVRSAAVSCCNRESADTACPTCAPPHAHDRTDALRTTAAIASSDACLLTSASVSYHCQAYLIARNILRAADTEPDEDPSAPPGLTFAELITCVEGDAIDFQVTMPHVHVDVHVHVHLLTVT